MRQSLFVGFVVAALAVGSAACAQDFTLSEAQFNSWLGNANTAPEAAIKAKLATQMRALEDACQLTPYQVEKLELAGDADLARFTTQVEVLRKELVGKTYNQNEINDVYQRISPLRQQIQEGVVGPSSLFFKVVQTALKPTQRDEYAEIERRRAETRYRAKVRLFVAAMDSAIAMTANQREELLALITDETRPPAKFGEYDWYYIMGQTAALPQGRIDAILEKPQAAILQRCLQQGRGMANFLEQQGIVPREDK